MDRQCILRIIKSTSSKGTLYNRIFIVVDNIQLPVQLDFTARSVLEQLIKD